MSLPFTTDGYVLQAGDGEGLDSWMGGARLSIKATAVQTGGKYAAVEFWGPKGAGSPTHIHGDDDEFFVVLDGEVRFKLADEVVDVGTRGFMYGPRTIPHAFTLNSDGARVLLFFGPAGPEGFFRDVSALAATVPPGEQPPMPALVEIAARYGQRLIGPPVPPQD